MTASLKDELLQALESWDVDPADLADPHASLIGGGLLDSLALFNLSTWLEERLGRPIDPASFDVMTEWDSVEAILRFIERQSGSAPAAVPVPAPPPEPPAPVVHRDGRYRIVRYEPQHLPDVARLMCGLWSPDPALNEAVFRWKYFDNPFAGEPLIYLALRDGKPVAMRAFCESAWEGEGMADPVAMYVADDFVVAEQDRNHGLFNLFTEAATADLRARGEGLFLSLSALRVTRLQLLASGSRSVGVLPTIARRPGWLRVLDQLADAAQHTPLLWRVAERLAAARPARSSFERLDAAAGQAIATAAGQVEICRQVPADELAGLVARLGHDGRIRHRRDARFFEWRYRHPLHAYRCLVARRDGRTVGYLVLQRGLSAFHNPRRVNIVDWACESDDVLRALIVTASEQGGLIDLVTWAEGPVFAQLGFVPADAHQAQRGLPCVLVRSLEEAEPRLGRRPLLDLASWDLRMAYTSFA
jgi:acyl carrier protein